MSLSRSSREHEHGSKSGRSQSAHGLAPTNSIMKIPLPPRLWLTDVSEDSSDEMREEYVLSSDRTRLRSRYRHKTGKMPVNMPIGIFWDIENCQVPRGCSASDVVAAIRAKFVTGRREADFVVVCDVRKESAYRLQELNDAQVNLIHVCGTQKNAADEKLRRCMRRFGELHSAPAALLLISGDINFAGDLSDFRYRKNMDVILVHKQNTSSALIACATTHYCYNELTANLPRKCKVSQTEEDEPQPSCELEVLNLPSDQAPERVSRRLRRLADNCGGKVLRVHLTNAFLKFPTPDHAARALKRMEGEDVFGNKIGTRMVQTQPQPSQATYSSDEGYGTATAGAQPAVKTTPVAQNVESPREPPQPSSDWAMALQQLPPAPRFCPPPTAPVPRKIRGTHGSSSMDQSACSSTSDDLRFQRDMNQSRAISPWNGSSFSEQSSENDASEQNAEITVTNLPLYEPHTLQDMIAKLFSQHVPVIRVSVWTAGEGPIAMVVLRSESDARLAIARIHKRRLDNQWSGRRLELSLGRPTPAPNLDILRARLRAILIDQKNCTLPLLRLRDAYASRHCCALTTSDLARVKDTVIMHEGCGRMVQLIDLSPVTAAELEQAPWKCHVHATLSTGQEDGTRILAPVYIEIEVLAQHVKVLLDTHGGVLPLLSFVECYEATFPALIIDGTRGVCLELLLRSIPNVRFQDTPSRHLVWDAARDDSPSPLSYCSGDGGSSRGREKPRTAFTLEPILSLYERELVDLLRTAPRCSIAFSKLIPAFHHHYGRQCRVADYGFTKLPDLLAALDSTIVILGSGSSRIITISAPAQSRRWTSDLLKIIRSQPGRSVFVHEIPQIYQSLFSKPFSVADYGVCTLHELMLKVPHQAIYVNSDGSITLPRKSPSPEEKSRTVQFAAQTIELLCYTPNLRMEFSRFVPAYHAHFGRQLRVAHFGCTKLVELFELIPEAVTVNTTASGEKEVRLAYRQARIVFGQRLVSICPVPLASFTSAYVAQFGGNPVPDILMALSFEELVIVAGGFVENDIVYAPGAAPQAVSMCLAAVAALSSDRSVRGSTEDYFIATYRDVTGQDPNINYLVAAGVITLVENRRIQLNAVWRLVWRVARILSLQYQSLKVCEIFNEYTTSFEPSFPIKEAGFDSILDFLRFYRELFVEDGSMGFSLCPGVTVPLGNQRSHSEDFSVFDTPPGQKGSRVFESPLSRIWSSPPASALPAPSALLAQEFKRRTRLAAQFNNN